MHRGDGQVHHDLHTGVVEHVLRGAGGRYVVLGGLGGGAIGVQVAQDQHLDVGEGIEVLQVGVGDDADTDEADPDRAGGVACGSGMGSGHRANPPSIRKR